MTGTQEILHQIKSSIKNDKDLDYFLIHQDRYRFILDQIQKLNLPPNAHVLEIGAHPLHLFTALEKLGAKVSGISSKHEPVTGNNIKSLNIETDKFPYPKNHFDLVLMAEVIEHLTANPDTYLKKIKSVLKPNGHLIITTPNAVNLKTRAKLLLGKNPAFTLDQLSETKTGDDSIYYRHNREFTLSELQTILAESGFTITKAQHFSAYTPFRDKLKPDSLPAKLIKTTGFLLTKLYPPLQDSLFLLVQKRPLRLHFLPPTL